ncbi:MAG TPA: aldehyde ferredoxin oxidoreductase N-terminal domain-containing protein, partial [Bacillota bacterium]|nr:aldehyde ferredoxin oxidoreductase N-terminal domain-containing protein [Bacillota bacterium]
MDWIIRVDTRTGNVRKERATSEELGWGGRLLVAKVLLREVPPTCEPLGRHNKLLFACGLLADAPI